MINLKLTKIFIKIYGVFVFLYSLITMILGVFLIAFKDKLFELLDATNIDNISKGLINGVGILFLVLAIALIVFGVGIFKNKKWARIFAIIILALSVIQNIASLFSAFSFYVIAWILVSIFYFYLFTFNKNTNKVFK